VTSVTTDDIHTLPPNLPAPEDDGAAAHLPGTALPSVSLPATDGTFVHLASVPGRAVVFAYPRTGRPDEPGDYRTEWNMIPGARGCTPQNCAIRDDHASFVALGVTVYGLSAQSPDDQREAARRLHLPHRLLSDESGALREALSLPSFEWQGRPLLRRLTMLLRDGVIEDVLYPVFPPDRAASVALARLSAPTRG
jgi:peroxiredoxin